MSRVTIKDLAKASGFSVCTVNKALTGKHWVSDETRKRIVELAEEMGYTPNRLAQSLARRSLTIGLIYPTFWEHWFEPLVTGSRQQLASLHDHNVSAKCYPVHGTTSNHNLDEILAQLAQDSLDGVLICMGAFDIEFAHGLRDRLMALQIPVVLLGGAHPDIPHISQIRTDARRCGEMAGELLCLLAQGTPLAIFLGKRAILDHEEKAIAFCERVRQAGMSVAGIFETLDDEEIAYHITRRLFTDVAPDTGGIYVAVDNAMPGVCRYLQEAGLAGKVRVIATGVFPEIGEWMTRGCIHMTLYQNMFEQGRVAVSTLYHYLIERQQPPTEILIPPQIIINSNFGVFTAGCPTFS